MSGVTAETTKLTSSPDSIGLSGEDSFKARKTSRLSSIQYLRAMAALMVVLHHVLQQYAAFTRMLPTESLQAGVDLFFVISGFIMVFVTAGRNRVPTQFFAMRIVRIVPVYWFYILAAAGLLCVAPSLFHRNELSFRHVFLSLFFIPHTVAADPGNVSPLVKQGWTLDFEMFFYSLFAIAMSISHRHRALICSFVLIGLSMIGFCSGQLGLRPTLARYPEISFYTWQIILEFAMGMILAEVFLRHKPSFLKGIPATALIVVGAAALFLSGPKAIDLRVIYYGIPATLILVGALALEAAGCLKQNSALLAVGDASYSIYLVHIFPVAVLRWMWNHHHINPGSVISLVSFAALSLTASSFLGLLSYRVIEKPSLKYLRRFLETHLLTRAGFGIGDHKVPAQ
jgi:exopolysaccharide production protein ExoZ